MCVGGFVGHLVGDTISSSAVITRTINSETRYTWTTGAEIYESMSQLIKDGTEYSLDGSPSDFSNVAIRPAALYFYPSTILEGAENPSNGLQVNRVLSENNDFVNKSNNTIVEGFFRLNSHSKFDRIARSSF